MTRHTMGEEENSTQMCLYFNTEQTFFYKPGGWNDWQLSDHKTDFIKNQINNKTIYFLCSRFFRCRVRKKLF
jgi:hypothetical protein